jgi:hypothetical protein
MGHNGAVVDCRLFHLEGHFQAWMLLVTRIVCFSFANLRPCSLGRLPMTLERRFMGSLVGSEGHPNLSQPPAGSGAPDPRGSSAFL